MKKILIVILIVFGFNLYINAISSIPFDPSNANTVYVSLNQKKQISLKDLSVISIKEYEIISGKKMNFFAKVNFKAGQRKLRNNISKDGTMTDKSYQKAMKIGDPSSGFHIGGFALGMLLGPIGVIVAYIIKGDEDVDRNRRKYAWAGFGIWVAMLTYVLSAAGVF